MPTTVLDGGVELIRWLQRWSPALDGLFRAISALGDLGTVLLCLAAIYWAVDRRAAWQIGLLYLFSALVNISVKAVLKQPRPFIYDPSVTALVAASGYGLPSGHTQGTMVLCGAIALRWRRSWVQALCLAAMVLVPLSRVYLGVHFYSDLLGGYLLGGLLLLCWHRWVPPPAENRQQPCWPLLLASALLLIMAPLAARLSSEAPLAMGCLAGFCLGAIVERRTLGFEPDDNLSRALARALVGILGLWLLNGALQLAQPAGAQAAWALARYTLLGLWCGWGAPVLMVRLRLASPGASSP